MKRAFTLSGAPRPITQYVPLGEAGLLALSHHVHGQICHVTGQQPFTDSELVRPIRSDPDRVRFGENGPCRETSRGQCLELRLSLSGTPEIVMIHEFCTLCPYWAIWVGKGGQSVKQPSPLTSGPPAGDPAVAPECNPPCSPMGPANQSMPPRHAELRVSETLRGRVRGGTGVRSGEWGMRSAECGTRNAGGGTPT
jgi:hypothetical protein